MYVYLVFNLNHIFKITYITYHIFIIFTCKIKNEFQFNLSFKFGIGTLSMVHEYQVQTFLRKIFSGWHSDCEAICNRSQRDYS